MAEKNIKHEEGDWYKIDNLIVNSKDWILCKIKLNQFGRWKYFIVTDFMGIGEEIKCRIWKEDLSLLIKVSKIEIEYVRNISSVEEREEK